MIRNRKVLIIGISITIIIVIAIVMTAIILSENSKKENFDEETKIDIEAFQLQFGDNFTNEGNEYISTLYQIQEEKNGKYKIQANIPYIQTGTEIDYKINKEVNEIFIKKLLQVYNESKTYTIVNIDYALAMKDNILSLAIKCVLKEGSNAQRTIMKTYNYNIEKNKIINIKEIVPEEKIDEVQERINKEIELKIKKEKTIIEQGYNVYRRQQNSDIYKLENATDFYVKDNILYIIYCYGNNNYTSEVDLIVVEI